MSRITALLERLKAEPVLLSAAILSIAALVGIEVDPDFVAGVDGWVVAVVPVLLGLITRTRVTPSRNVDHLD